MGVTILRRVGRDGRGADAATIREVAARAEESVATVFAVLNRARYANQGLAERARGSAVARDYPPDILARSLKKRCAHMPGLFRSGTNNSSHGKRPSGRDRPSWAS